MTCSYCGKPLPEGDKTVHDTPNVYLENRDHKPILALHAECIRSVITGLEYAERLVMM